MKKTICIILSLVLIFSASLPVFAEEKETELYPTIIVAGYSSSSLYNETENGTKQVWGVNIDDILSAVLHNIAKIGIGLGGLAFGNAEYIANVVGSEMYNLYGVLAYDESGKSVNNISTYSKAAADTQFSYLESEVNGEHMHEPEIMATVAEKYEEYGLNGNDWIFSFQTDFRQNIIDCAADLDKYIESVLEFTGSDKVNLYAVSHGGEVCAVYFSLYGAEKDNVNNAVLTVPAIGGAALAADVMSENIIFDEETLLYFIENGMMLEEDYNWLVRANQFGILDDICYYIVHNHAKRLLGYWGSMWDFLPEDFYDDLKASSLDPVKSAELIAKSDAYHYDILPKMSENLNKCVEKGTHIYIVAGTDNPSVTGLQQQSDAIITVNSSTGAYCAPYGMRFADGYSTKNTVCTDTSHNHLSPAMTVDASCAYLPENTWYVNGLFHGMTWKDDYCVDLCMELLFNNDSLDIYSFEEYPQFKFSNNRCYSATAFFNKSKEGYWSAEDTVLTVKNLSHEYEMRLDSVYCAGADITFEVKTGTKLAPGESTDVAFKGSLPEKSLTTADITVNYTLKGCLTPYGSRTLTFTLNNGEADEYDESAPFVSAKQITEFDKLVGNKFIVCVLEKAGLFDWLKMIFNSLYAMFAGLDVLPRC